MIWTGEALKHREELEGLQPTTQLISQVQDVLHPASGPRDKMKLPKKGTNKMENKDYYHDDKITAE
jgi:hypothetical protein